MILLFMLACKNSPIDYKFGMMIHNTDIGRMQDRKRSNSVVVKPKSPYVHSKFKHSLHKIIAYNTIGNLYLSMLIILFLKLRFYECY